MDVDDSARGELKIKGRAAAEKKEQDGRNDDEDPEMRKRESELKEKALRNKVVRSRKNTNA
ncbi:hypothetical protein PUNSTDRAFT_134885 [Punctularia strigosozonata HHB-11173 SS5]|uniref:uncharacterized protein n=1 Tax=Punctularia strigosozonata (strain HHB-11173) TaxID=741275 RepID=UPI0004417D09|nr:uncharacterized protein PUNSTDRAFT_134885 [Punctularia strigosozonata HHB-11173 SS5]EIN08509.1 hypothetical protein PUNSTDRAFT_134885 [Punctularia strigosozonata HHB-11173 SS5]